MNDRLRAIAGLDRLIHEPARMMIITLLAAVDECDFLFLMRETGLSKGNLSSHLAKLEDARYVEIHKTYRGKVPLTVLRLSQEGRTTFDSYRSQLNAVLIENLKPSPAGAKPELEIEPRIWTSSAGGCLEMGLPP